MRNLPGREQGGVAVPNGCLYFDAAKGVRAGRQAARFPRVQYGCCASARGWRGPRGA